MARRLVGMDLGVATAHTVVVLNEEGRVVARRRCRGERHSLEALERAALKDAPEGTRLEVVFEATGAAWLPVAVFFVRRGHLIYRVSTAKSSALRKFWSRHAKSNVIDAHTLAQLALIDDGLLPIELPEGARASLDRRVRAADRLRDLASAQKTRIRELARHLMPMLDEAVTGELGHADIAVLERYGDPRRMLRAGPDRLTALIRKVSHGHHGQARAEAWLAVARQAVELYRNDPAVAFEDLAAELASEARLWRASETEHHAHAQAREAAYQHVDPAGLARSLPGVATTGGPVIVAVMGRPGRFPNADAFKAFTGLTPKASQTGVSDRKGQAMTKPGRGGCVISSSSRPTPPARSTRSSPRSIGLRWSSGAHTTPKHFASSLLDSPLAHIP